MEGIPSGSRRREPDGDDEDVHCKPRSIACKQPRGVLQQPDAWLRYSMVVTQQEAVAYAPVFAHVALSGHWHEHCCVAGIRHAP